MAMWELPKLWGVSVGESWPMESKANSAKYERTMQGPIVSFKFGQTFLLRRCHPAREALARHRPRHRRQAQGQAHA